MRLYSFALIYSVAPFDYNGLLAWVWATWWLEYENNNTWQERNLLPRNVSCGHHCIMLDLQSKHLGFTMPLLNSCVENDSVVTEYTLISCSRWTYISLCKKIKSIWTNSNRYYCYFWLKVSTMVAVYPCWKATMHQKLVKQGRCSCLDKLISWSRTIPQGWLVLLDDYQWMPW